MKFRSSSRHTHSTRIKKIVNTLGSLLPPRFGSVSLISLLALAFSLTAGAQSWPPAVSVPDAPQSQEQVTLRGTPLNILKDEGAIWSSPARIRDKEFGYLIPLGLAVTAAITTDHQAMTQVVSTNTSFNNTNTNASNVLVSPFIAAPAVMFAAGHFTGNDHARESGILGGEAILDSLVVEQGMKFIFWRERPTVDNGKGKFFQTSVGWDSSFPSSHSVIAWSSAAVLAEEYPSRLNQLGIYTLATGVSLTRVLGQQHFPSDVLVGSAFGWMIGHYVYKKHHRWHEPISR
jgi:membrane-associated phospholipid phosphatase